MTEKIRTIEEEAAVKTAASEDTESNEEVGMIIKFKKPYTFEKKEYTEIDLSGLDDLTAADMISVNKRMQRTSQGIDVMPEVTLEYACELAAKGAKMPVEFFMNLPPKEAIKVKNRIMSFLFGSE